MAHKFTKIAQTIVLAEANPINGEQNSSCVEAGRTISQDSCQVRIVSKIAQVHHLRLEVSSLSIGHIACCSCIESKPTEHSVQSIQFGLKILS